MQNKRIIIIHMKTYAMVKWGIDSMLQTNNDDENNTTTSMTYMTSDLN